MNLWTKEKIIISDKMPTQAAIIPRRRKLALALGYGLLGSWIAPAGMAAGDCSAATDWAERLRRDLDLMAQQLTQTLRPWAVPDRIFHPETYGAAAGGLATLAIQAAIDACAAAGGGVVRLAKGDYVSGTIALRSGVMLEVAEGCRLLGSTNLTDYPNHQAQRLTVMDSNMGMNQSLIFAEHCERVGIRGEGTIDGQGTQKNFPGEGSPHATPGRPFLIRMLDCKNVVIANIHLKDAPCWMQNYLNCEDLLIDGIHVENQVNYNNDGLDIDGCRRVIVRNCFINSEDDGMCFKGASQRPTENVLVENSQFFSSCNAMKFGTDSQGDFRNILVRNVVLGGPSNDMRAFHRRKADGGISWETVDGGTVERVLVHDAQIVRSESPLFLCIGHRGRVRPEQPRPMPGVMRYLVFDRITGDDNGMRGSFFTGFEDQAIEHVLLRDVHLAMAGPTEAAINPATIPEIETQYPDPHMFSKVMPAYGLWTRHVRDLNLLRVRFTGASDDGRAMILSDVDANVTCLDKEN
jgi:hypothetical protein